MKTIKELADELGVSKTAVRKYMTPEFREAHTQTTTGNTIKIDEDGCKLIAETIQKPTETSGNQFPQTPENPGLQEEIAFLRAQLEAKDRQLEAKDRQLEQKDKQLEARDAQIVSLTTAMENTTASLQAAQALHAGTIKTQLPEGEVFSGSVPNEVEILEGFLKEANETIDLLNTENAKRREDVARSLSLGEFLKMKFRKEGRT